MNWPNRQSSRFIQVGDQKWHLQTIGQGPPLLMLHGTGSSCHSWASIAPILAAHFTLIMPDLPGHGFTQTPPESGLSLPGMARLLRDLLMALDVEPAFVIGHSAGAAIASEMTLDGFIRPQAILAINGAFQPFKGLAALLFPVAAHVLALNPVTIYAVAGGAKDRRRIERLMHSTGSIIPDDMLARYRDLFTAPGHVAGMLGMMANWNLAPLVKKMAGLPVPIYLLSGSKDAAVTPASAQALCRTVPKARFINLPHLGHIAHEEDPEAVAAVILSVLAPPTT
ncbi:MAG: alpha/beta fold hydrolase BchO [Hyphomonadaceae bacterium]|jgi:magnesium chelatase accessory protein